MRLAVAATPSVALPTLDWLLTSIHNLELIITRPDRPAGRGKILQQSPVAHWAIKNQVRMYKPENSRELLERLENIECVITIGYGVILPSSVLKIPKFGFTNIHFSLLPAWRGAAPVQRAIEHGDLVTGVTVFSLDAGMDTGPIYVQKELEIGEYETAGELLIRMAHLGPALIDETLNLISAGVAPTAQSEIGSSVAKKISKNDAKIDWNRSADRVSQQIRAFTPEPGAWTNWREATIQILRCHIAIGRTNLLPGEIAIDSGNLLVGCAESTTLQIGELKAAGKREMSAKEWLNGARCNSGERFG